MWLLGTWDRVPDLGSRLSGSSFSFHVAVFGCALRFSKIPLRKVLKRELAVIRSASGPGQRANSFLRMRVARSLVASKLHERQQSQFYISRCKGANENNGELRVNITLGKRETVPGSLGGSERGCPEIYGRLRGEEAETGFAPLSPGAPSEAKS